MREIKFRGWDNEKKRMGFVSTMQFPRPWGGEVFEPTHEVLFGTTSVEFTTNEIELMQYTGLRDKNGKEIYEGDVVKMDAGTNEECDCVVDWLDCGFVLVGEGYAGENLFAQTRDGMFGEVIGNIHQNPELLK